MVRPGHLTKAQLTEVEPGIFLGVRAARAYRRVKAAFHKRGKSFGPVNEYSAYRNEHVQNGMADASRTRSGSAARARFNLSSTSTVSVAYSPNGSHQDGRGLDFLINGSSGYPNAADRALLAKHGWKFQFGSDDSNHVRHNNLLSITPVTRKWCVANRLWVQPAHK